MSLAKILDLIRFISLTITLIGFYLLKKGLILETGYSIYFLYLIPSIIFAFTCLFPMIFLWGEELLIIFKNKKKAR